MNTPVSLRIVSTSELSQQFGEKKHVRGPSSGLPMHVFACCETPSLFFLVSVS